MSQRDYNEEIRIICSNILFDPKLSSYKNQLIDWKKVESLFIFPNQFFFINDFVQLKNIYVHPNVEKITGYPVDFFTELGNIFSIIHPDDRDCVFEFSNRTVAFAQEHKERFKNDPLFFTFMIDFRIRKATGEYIRLNRSSCCFNTDDEGNVIDALVLFTDITALKSVNTISFSYTGDPDSENYFQDLIEKYKTNINLTKREQEILYFLAEGYSATEIAKRLYISENTVITHRKHLLRKTGTKNTAELVKFAIEKNILNMK